MRYHCLRRWPNIETTLDRRFVFVVNKTVILIVKSGTKKITTEHCKPQCWFNGGHPSARLALH